MSSSNGYTFELTNTPFARDHALHCLSMRPDDFVEYGKAIRQDTPNQTKYDLQNDHSLSFILAYEGGQLMNQVGAVKVVDGGNTVFVQYGMTAPVNGGLSYVYGNLFLELLRFLSSEGYLRFSTTYQIGHPAAVLYVYFSEAFPQYNFTFGLDGTVGKLTIDLVDL